MGVNEGNLQVVVSVSLIVFCPADHVADWQPRILLGTVEARSVNVKKTTTFIIAHSPKKETFSSKVGIEPPSTPLLRFQGSRGSRKIKK